MFNVSKPGTYDFVLALATIITLVALSAVSIYGTVESWVNSVRDPNWAMGWSYADYLNRMNSYAYPLVVALVLILCMCIPKRFVPRNYLLQLSLVFLALSFMIGMIRGPVIGFGFLLVVSAIIQAAVVAMVVTRSGSLVFEREGLMTQLGSALLHLGFITFVLDLMLIEDPQNHLSVFWISTALIILGSVLSLYSRELSLALRSVTGEREVALLDARFNGSPDTTDIPDVGCPVNKTEN
ncbi:MAG: hypothetical protein IBX64_12010 [Actinobacteria bacterium]|nr:hypothetical protein [Actinomycetota bacterium]